MSNQEIINQDQYLRLQEDVAQILSEAKDHIQGLTNTILAGCYWRVGKRLSQENLTENANYQNLTLKSLEEDLGIDKDTLGKAIRFYECYKDGSQEGLSWSHYRKLISVKDASTRESLTQQAKSQQWSVKQLETSIKNLNNGVISGKASTVKGKSASKIKRPTDPSYLYKAKIVNVVDGDTLILHIDLGFGVIKEQRVRLTQIDAPEIKTPQGVRSYQYLRDLCAGIEKVAVKTNKVDIYGRFLADIFYLEGELKNGTTQADIFTQGIYLNAKIVEDKMAEVI